MQHHAVARETSVMLPGEMSVLTALPATAHSLSSSSGHAFFSPIWNFWMSMLIFWCSSRFLKARSPWDSSARCSPSAAPVQQRVHAAAHVPRARRGGAQLHVPPAPAQPMPGQASAGRTHTFLLRKLQGRGFARCGGRLSPPLPTPHCPPGLSGCSQFSLLFPTPYGHVGLCTAGLTPLQPKAGAGHGSPAD